MGRLSTDDHNRSVSFTMLVWANGWKRNVFFYDFIVISCLAVDKMQREMVLDCLF